MKGRILKIARMGHPVLYQECEEIDPVSHEAHQIIADMRATMEDCGTIAGLAAPQVYVNKRIVIFSLPASRSRGSSHEDIPETIMINPEIEILSREQYFDWEGCLSIPDLIGEVPRFRSIRYHYFTPDGSRVTREATGHHARVVQHECDHLDGILQTQRMIDIERLVYRDEGLRYWVPRTS